MASLENAQADGDAEEVLANVVEIEVAEMVHDSFTHDDNLEPILSTTRAKRELRPTVRHMDEDYYLQKCNVALYPALFYFDNNDWSISEWDYD